MIGKSKLFIISTGLSEDITLQKHCIPGLQDLPLRAGYYFFCVERTFTKYIHIHQYDKERRMQISEVLAFEKTKRKCLAHIPDEIAQPISVKLYRNPP